MIEVVLDASVLLKWFNDLGEANLEQARALRAHFEDGLLQVFAPPLLWLEVLNVAARSWRWEQKRVCELAARLPQLGIKTIEPELAGVARWTAAGLTAYDAAYVALAEQTGAELITDDHEIVRLAAGVASALNSWTTPADAADAQREDEPQAKPGGGAG